MKDINLIPRQYFRDKVRPWRIMLYVLIILLAAGLMAYEYMTPFNIVRQLEAESKSYDDTLIEYNTLVNQIKDIQLKQELTAKRLAILKEISKTEVKPTEVYTAVRKVVPKDVWLTNYSYSPEAISLVAFSKTAVGAMEFYIELSKIPLFKNVTISPITIDTTGYNFSIQLSMSTGSDENVQN